MPAIGIDLGTTFSCVGVWFQGKVEIVANGLGSRTTPSCVAFTDTERLVGEPARNQAARNPSNTIYDMKRLIGRRFTDLTVQQDIRRWPFRVVDDAGKPMVEVKEMGSLHRIGPVEISAMILEHMRTIAETFLGCRITDAVITVPAYFNDAQRQATKDAGTVAGLNVLRILNEPTAAALAYGQIVEPRPVRNVLIFDLGGGTFDVSILTIRDGLEFEVRSTAGDTHLGGQDFDNLIVEYFVDLFQRRTGLDVRNNTRAMARLKAAAERAKHNLSFSTEVNVEVDVLLEGIDFHTKFSRARFEDLCAPLFAQTFEPVRQALSDSGLAPENIDDIVLVGGSTRIPKIQSMLRSFFKNKPLSLQINPDEAVAIGAAIQAAILIRDDSWVIRNLILRDVIPLSLGIGLEDGGVKRIVTRNSHIPCVYSGGTKTCIDDQTAVLFEVYEGERPFARDNNLLGSYVIDEIPPGPRGAIKFDTTFSIDADGILTVSSRERRTGKSQQITIGGDEHRWTRAEVHSMLREAQHYKRSDEAMRKRFAARRALENRAYEIKHALSAPAAAAALTASQLVQARSLYQAQLDWLDTDTDAMMQPGGPYRTDAADIEQRLMQLEEKYRPFAEMLADLGVYNSREEEKLPMTYFNSHLGGNTEESVNNSVRVARSTALSPVQSFPKMPSSPKMPLIERPRDADDSTMYYLPRSPHLMPY